MSNEERMSYDKIREEMKQEQKDHMSTVGEMVDHLREKGYVNDFQMTEVGFICKDTNEVFRPDDLTIERVYRFEGESNPDDMAIIYQLKASSGTLGIFIDAYGTYGSYDAQELGDFLRKVRREDGERA